MRRLWRRRIVVFGPLASHVSMMAKALIRPDRGQLQLDGVLRCLGDPLRLAIVAKLADIEDEVQELRCRDFGELGSKSNLTYHFDKLREAGVVSIRLVATSRYLKIRRADLNARFPGLLSAVLYSAKRDTDV